jgi:hypothetical protein
MRHTALVSFLLLALPALALAQSAETTCTYGDIVRRVAVLTEPGVSVPCEVHYFKDTEAPGEDRVLWGATQQAGYCEEKAAGLVAKLEGSGWDCGDVAPPAEPPEPAEPADAAKAPEAPEAPADTTSDLAPAAPEDGEE